MVSIRPFKKYDLEVIEKRGGLIWADGLGEWYEENPSISIFDDERIIFCGGIVYLWPNTGSGWLFTVPDIKQYKEILVSVVKTFIRLNFISMKLDRIQTAVQADFVDGLKFMTILGWKQEGVMERYAYGKDFYLYSFVGE